MAVPATISEWSKIALQYESPVEATATHLASLGIVFASIRASMPTFHDYSNSANIITSLCALDTEYEHWVSHLPTEFQYRTFPIPSYTRCDVVFGDHYHDYHSVWIGAVWNHYRCVRILVNEILLDQLSFMLQTFNPSDTIDPSMISQFESDPLFESDLGNATPDATFYASLLFAASATLHTLADDICASVPYFLNSFPNGPTGSNPSFTFSAPSSTPPKAVVGNILLWPLYTAACTGHASNEMRNWTANMLQSISETMGIRQAAPLAETLRTTLDLDTLEWEDENPTEDVEDMSLGLLDEEESDGSMLGLEFGQM